MQDETDKSGEVEAKCRPLTPTPLPPSAKADIRRLGERGLERGISNSVPSPLAGEGQGEGVEQPQYGGEPGRPLYEALLYPNRSLSPRGFLILSVVTAIFGLAYGVLFLTIGAWPIFAFLGAEWLLFWWLLRKHFHADRGAERIRLYADRLVLQRIDAKGEVAQRVYEPYWLRVVLEERGFENPALLLRSHGSSTEIGAFLSPAERRSFAAEFNTILSRWRSA